jgi:competence protein ComEA
MNKLKNFIALYFNLSKKESNGFIILCIFMLTIIFAPSIYQSFLAPKQELLLSDKKTLDSLVVLLDNNQPEKFQTSERRNQEKGTITYNSFNPNASSEEEMTLAGVPKFISKRIIKFREKGGKFKTRSDLKKIYGLSETDFQKLYSYIKLPEKINKDFYKNDHKIYSKEFTSKNDYKKSFDLNTADSLQLVSLKGIGPAFASRIIKYRKKLGGFIFKEQLKEVYGLDSNALGEMDMRTTIDRNFIPSKININSSNLILLASHPYIGKKTAQLIVNYYTQHGIFASIDQLKNIKPITEEIYLKIAPYLSLE